MFSMVPVYNFHRQKQVIWIMHTRPLQPLRMRVRHRWCTAAASSWLRSYLSDRQQQRSNSAISDHSSTVTQC